MDSNEKILTHGKVLIISIALFLVILAILIAISIVSILSDSNEFSSDAQSVISNAVSADIKSSVDMELNMSQNIEESENVDSSEISEENSTSEAESSEPEELNHGWIINEYGYTYVYDDCGYEQFNFSNNVLERYAQSLKNLANCIPSGTRFFNITVPVSSTFASIPRDIYVADNFYNKSQSAFISTVSSKLGDEIINIPLVSTMQENYDEGEYIFFRTDKNWTSLGAYLAYKAFCENAGLVPFSPSNFAQTDVGDYLGNFYKATKSKDMAENPDRLICYGTVPSVKTVLTVYDEGIVYTDFKLCDNSVNSNNAYNFYLGTLAERYEINSTATGGSLLVIGDSSSHPMIPLLASHYSKIDLIDPNYFQNNINDFLKNRHYDDVISMCYSTNATSGDYIPAFNTMLGVTIDG